MDYNTSDIRKSIIKDFPKLDADSRFVVCSPFTFEYNCIAFAMGFEDRWVDHLVCLPWHWWPNGVVRNQSEQALKEAFGALGFEECLDDCIETDYDKVALYSKDGEWKHAAKIVEGAYHSKFGAMHDALHSGGAVLDNVYGTPYCFMKRLKSCRSMTESLKPTRPGVMHVNLNGCWFAFYDGVFYTERGKKVQVFRDAASGKIIINKC